MGSLCHELRAAESAGKAGFAGYCAARSRVNGTNLTGSAGRVTRVPSDRLSMTTSRCVAPPRRPGSPCGRRVQLIEERPGRLRDRRGDHDGVEGRRCGQPW